MAKAKTAGEKARRRVFDADARRVSEQRTQLRAAVRGQREVESLTRELSRRVQRNQDDLGTLAATLATQQRRVLMEYEAFESLKRTAIEATARNIELENVIAAQGVKITELLIELRAAVAEVDLVVEKESHDLARA